LAGFALCFVSHTIRTLKEWPYHSYRTPGSVSTTHRQGCRCGGRWSPSRWRRWRRSSSLGSPWSTSPPPAPSSRPSTPNRAAARSGAGDIPTHTGRKGLAQPGSHPPPLMCCPPRLLCPPVPQGRSRTLIKLLKWLHTWSFPLCCFQRNAHHKRIFFWITVFPC